MPIGKVPPIPSFTDIVGSLLKKQVEKGIYGLNKEIPDGTRVSSRLDIPAYERYDKWIVSIHDSFHKGRKDSIQGEAIAYGKTIVLNNVSFKSLPSRGLKIAAGAEKNTIGRIFGDIKNEAPESVASRAKRHLNEDEWSEIGFNPYRHGFFYNKATGLPVATADEVVQIGPLVLARNAKKMTISEMKQTGAEGLPVRAGKPIEGLKNLKRTKTLFKKGGTIMKEQMELFQEGGLQEEGGTVDPVSGNEVPIGSTKEEVRDDIPAQLSEGEFVFPADVVRFIGLEKLMQLRQEAKAGLKKMEEMGQMGNSDEATLPDDIPFTVDDLDTREETEEEKVEMARGGIIQAQAGTFVNPNFGTFTRPSYVAPQFQMNQTPIPTLPNTQQLSPAPVGGFTPTFYNVTPKPQTGPGSTFQDLIGRRPGQYDEFRKYVNESGMILNIPFKDGEPLYPIPEGYTFQDPEEEKVKDPEVTGLKPETTRVVETQDDDGGDGGSPQGSSISLGGTIDYNKTNRLGGPVRGSYLTKDATTFTTSFNIPGLSPLTPGAAIKSGLLGISGEYPKGTTVSMKLGNISKIIGIDEYNSLKNNTTGEEAKNFVKGMKDLRDFNRGVVTVEAGEYKNRSTGEDYTPDQVVSIGKDIAERIGAKDYDKEFLGFDISADAVDEYNKLSDAEQDAYNDYATEQQEQEEGDRIGSVPTTSFTPTTGMFDSDDDDEQQSYDSPSDDGGVSQETQDTFGDTGEADFDPVAKGSLITKRKASGKIKKKYMKRGGLASR